MARAFGFTIGDKLEMATVKIDRTSAGLKDALFEAIEALRSGDIEPGEAKMIAGLSREIVSVTRLELDIYNYRIDNNLMGKATEPPSIKMVTSNAPSTDLPPMPQPASGDNDADGPQIHQSARPALKGPPKDS